MVIWSVFRVKLLIILEVKTTLKIMITQSKTKVISKQLLYSLKTSSAALL